MGGARDALLQPALVLVLQDRIDQRLVVLQVLPGAHADIAPLEVIEPTMAESRNRPAVSGMHGTTRPTRAAAHLLYLLCGDHGRWRRVRCRRCCLEGLGRVLRRRSCTSWLGGVLRRRDCSIRLAWVLCPCRYSARLGSILRRRRGWRNTRCRRGCGSGLSRTLCRRRCRRRTGRGRVLLRRRCGGWLSRALWRCFCRCGGLSRIISRRRDRRNVLGRVVCRCYCRCGLSRVVGGHVSRHVWSLSFVPWNRRGPHW